jgi:ribosome-associated protein
LAIKKQARRGAGERLRPPLKSSHERVLERGPRKPRPSPPVSGGATRSPPPRGGATRKTPRRATRAQSDGGARAVRLPKRPRPEVHAPPETSNAWSLASETARERATTIAIAALDKKAVGLEILDVAGKVDYADFLVIMTGRSDRHTQALAQGIEEALKKKGVRPMAIEGLPHGNWVLMDFGDVVVHVFQDEMRQLYDIEGLWLDARRLPVPASAAGD